MNYTIWLKECLGKMHLYIRKRGKKESTQEKKNQGIVKESNPETDAWDELVLLRRMSRIMMGRKKESNGEDRVEWWIKSRMVNKESNDKGWMQTKGSVLEAHQYKCACACARAVCVF